MFEKNVYLAEDRILCIELVAKRGASYRCGSDERAVMLLQGCVGGW